MLKKFHYEGSNWRWKNQSDLVFIVIHSTGRNDNIFGIHDPSHRDLPLIPCRSWRSPILWLSTTGHGWPFVVRLLPSRGSALHQRHLWDCEHAPQKEKFFFFLGFDRVIRLRKYTWQINRDKNKNKSRTRASESRQSKRRTTHEFLSQWIYISYMYRWTGDQARRCIVQIETVQVRSSKRKLRGPWDGMVVLYQSLDEKTRVCRRSAQGTERSSQSWHLSYTTSYRIRSIG